MTADSRAIRYGGRVGGGKTVAMYMSDKVPQLIHACRVPDTVKDQRRFPWEIKRQSIAGLPHAEAFAVIMQLFPYESSTVLYRDTIATMHQTRGEVVMEDSPKELRRHLPILLAARGRVLVSGLGLGCVVRGLLSKPEVDHIDVVEVDPSIVWMVGSEFADNKRVTIHVGDALTIPWPAGSFWDFAWHDVWSEEENLQLLHAQLFKRYESSVGKQGAWMFPRYFSRRIRYRLLGAPKR